MCFLVRYYYKWLLWGWDLRVLFLGVGLDGCCVRWFSVFGFRFEGGLFGGLFFYIGLFLWDRWLLFMRVFVLILEVEFGVFLIFGLLRGVCLRCVLWFMFVIGLKKWWEKFICCWYGSKSLLILIKFGIVCRL